MGPRHKTINVYRAFTGGEENPDGIGDPRSATLGKSIIVIPPSKLPKLMQYLCRLVTPPGGTVLDPFCGSGSTGIAALREGFAFVGIEREPEYIEIARYRILGDAPLFNRERNLDGGSDLRIVG